MSTVASRIAFIFLIAAIVMQRIVLARAAFVRVATTTSRRNVLSSPLSFMLNSRSASVRLLATGTKQQDFSFSKLTVRGTPNESRPFHLVIVESPSKCETISKILKTYVQDQELPHDYVVASSMGHVRNLPSSNRNHKKSSSSDTSKNETTIVGVDVKNGYQPTYEILPGKKGLVQELQQLAARAEHVVLATDDDREGEAVAWHLLQLLYENENNNKKTKKQNYSRVTFTEITPTAIRQAMQDPSPTLNVHLVEAQETRRILDRLAGYTLSPILWKKIAPGLSAGRVQSVGMALVVQRERERLAFQSAEYWDLNGKYAMGTTQEQQQQQQLSAHMVAWNGVPLATGSDFDNRGQLTAKGKHHLATESSANELVKRLAGDDVTWTVVSVQSTKRRESPPVPFTTSTLQQESNKRLGLSVSQTMRNAQSLYEAGFISYMRTDSTRISNDAHKAIELVVTSSHGSDRLAPKRKEKAKSTAKQKAKNKATNSNTALVAPQDAHEAVRPALQEDGTFLHPKQLDSSDPTAVKLYELIYQRTLATRMTPLLTNQTSVEIEGTDGETTATFRTSGSIVLDPGYTLAMPKVSSSNGDSSILPPLVQGQHLSCAELQAVDHATQAPPRYTEASFVKKLEELGVGRPSTYAHTVQVLRDRAYVGTPIRANGKQYQAKEMSGPAISAHRAAGGEEFTGGGRGPMVPSLSAFVVCSLLENNCPTYVDPTFTAGMEERLDEIAQGVDTNENSRVAYLDEFYAGDNGLAATVERMDREISADEARRANLPSLFKKHEADEDDIGLFIGPWGPYIQKISSSTTSEDEKPLTAPLPPGMAADLSTITAKTLSALLSSRETDGIMLGTHPEDGRDIRLKVGRFGAFLQWGKDGTNGTTTHSLPKHIGGMRNIENGGGVEGESLGDMIGLTLDDAVGYVGLPRTVCTLDDLPIVAAIGPYGPYLKYNNSFASLYEKDGDVLTVDEETAKRVVSEGIINKPKGMGRGVVAELGEMDGSMVRVKEGRFGVYINWKKVNAKLPAEYKETPKDLPLEEAWDLIQKKAATNPSKAAGRKKKAKKGAEDDALDDSVILPTAPKRPLSAYLHFCAEKRPEASKSFKALGDVSKELSRLWAATDPATVGNAELRRKYEELAAEGKQEYQTKMKEWKEECQKVLAATPVTKKKKVTARKNGVKKKKKNGAKKKTTAKTSAPKKPRSAYIYFCSAKRPEASKKFKKLGDISKELARLWAETLVNDGEGRHEYEKLAAEDKVRYEEEMLRYQAGTFE